MFSCPPSSAVATHALWRARMQERARIRTAPPTWTHAARLGLAERTRTRYRACDRHLCCRRGQQRVRLGAFQIIVSDMPRGDSGKNADPCGTSYGDNPRWRRARTWIYIAYYPREPNQGTYICHKTGPFVAAKRHWVYTNRTFPMRDGIIGCILNNSDPYVPRCWRDRTTQGVD